MGNHSFETNETRSIYWSHRHFFFLWLLYGLAILDTAAIFLMRSFSFLLFFFDFLFFIFSSMKNDFFFLLTRRDRSFLNFYFSILKSRAKNKVSRSRTTIYRQESEKKSQRNLYFYKYLQVVHANTMATRRFARIGQMADIRSVLTWKNNTPNYVFIE